MKKLKGETAKGIMIGVVMTSVMFTSISTMAMSARKTIEVVYSNIKLVVDGQEVTPRDGNGNIVEPFVYNGTTYLPLRACVNAISGGEKEVTWDGNNSTIYIGEYKKQSSAVDMSTLKRYNNQTEGATFTTGKTFINRQQEYAPTNILSMNVMATYNQINKGYQSQLERVVYLLDRNYKTLNATVASIDGQHSEATFEFYNLDTGDLLKSVVVKQGEKPVDISVDVSGVDKLEIKYGRFNTNHKEFQGNINFEREWIVNGALYNATLE